MSSWKGYLLSIDCHNGDLVDGFEPGFKNLIRVEELDESWYLEVIHFTNHNYKYLNFICQYYANNPIYQYNYYVQV